MPAKFVIRDHPADPGTIGASSGATGWHQSDVVVMTTNGATFPLDTDLTNPSITSLIYEGSNNYVKVRISNFGTEPVLDTDANDLNTLDPDSVQVRIFSPGRTQFSYPSDYLLNENFPGLAYDPLNPILVIKPQLPPAPPTGRPRLVILSGSFMVLTFPLTDLQVNAMAAYPSNRHFCMVAGILDGSVDGSLPSSGYLGNTFLYPKLAQRNLDLIPL